MTQELLVLDKRKAPTFVMRVRQGVLVLDLTISSLVFDEPSLLDHRYTLYQIDTSRDSLKSIRNPRNADWSKFRCELGDKLSNYNGFRAMGKDDLEVMAVMLDTSTRDAFTLSCPEKIIQDKSLWWTKEPNKLRKNNRRKLRVSLRQNVLERGESYREAQR